MSLSHHQFQGNERFFCRSKPVMFGNDNHLLFAFCFSPVLFQLMLLFVSFRQQEVGGSLYLVMEVGCVRKKVPVRCSSSELGLKCVRLVFLSTATEATWRSTFKVSRLINLRLFFCSWLHLMESFRSWAVHLQPLRWNIKIPKGGQVYGLCYGGKKFYTNQKHD